MKTANETLSERTDRIDLEVIHKNYKWLFQDKQDCIISPDCDGLLCGLLMSNILKWRIRGFYDGKVIVHDDRVKEESCVFLDMEIFRKNYRSVGQHMLLYNKNCIPEKWTAFHNCFAINNLRQYDKLHDFGFKYPFGTIHFLLVLFNKQLTVGRDAIEPLLFADGTYHNLFRYTENSLNWLHYLGADQKSSPLYELFMRRKYTLTELMSRMNDFWRVRDSISVRGQRGDRVAITERGGSGSPINMNKVGKVFQFDVEAKQRAMTFLQLLADKTGWVYDDSMWSWSNWKMRLGHL